MAKSDWNFYFEVGGGLLSNLSWTNYGFFVYKCDSSFGVYINLL